MTRAPRTIRVLEAVGEGTHGSFYIPVYAGMALGTYAEAGLGVDLRSVPFREGERHLAAGAGDVLIAAPMRTMRLFELTGTRIVSFAEIASRQPFCLLARRADPDFDWLDLKGKRLINFGDAETPILCLRFALRRLGVPDHAVTVIDHLTVYEALEAFHAGAAEYLLHPLDTVAALIEEGQAHVVAPLAPAVGHIPFTTWGATPSFARDCPDQVVSMIQGHNRALAWIATHADAELADLVRGFFPQVPVPRLIRIISQYRSWELWPGSHELSEAAFVFYNDLLASTGWLQGKVPYDAIAAEIAV